jgi:hypothetical protein
VIGVHHLPQILCQERVAGKAGWEYTAHLHDTRLTNRGGFQSQRIADNNLAIRGRMLITFHAVGINDTYILNHAIKVHYSISATTNRLSDALIE